MKLRQLLLLMFFYTPASAQWQWLNPQPSGNGCSKIIFTDTLKGFILNSNGDLLTTTDQGGIWHVQQNFPNAVTMDMKDSTGVICGYAGTVHITRDNGISWERKLTGISDYFLMADVVSRDTLFLANNNGKIYRSDDGGNSWKTFNCGIQISSIEFINSKVGYAGGASAYILKTIDGGQTWQQVVTVNIFPSNTMAIKFFDLNIGFAFREHSTMLSTKDGGNTWTSYNIGDRIFSIYFLSATTAFATGEHGVIYRTDDGGVTWQWIGHTAARIYAYDLSSVYFFNSDTGFTVGARGRILKTTDGGTTWNTYSPTYIDISDLSVPAPDISYATVANTIYKSTDAGQTWNQLGLMVGTNYAEYDLFQTCYFISADTGFVTASDPARTYKTYDGGVTWRMIKPTLSDYEDVTSLQFLDRNTGFLAINIYYGGTIVKTKDAGETWNPVWGSQYNGEIFHKIFFNDEKTGYASRYDRLFKTIDSAKTWTELWDDQTITSIWFINASKGFVVGENGMLKQTLDSGKTWNQISISSQFYDDIYTIKFFNDQVGYITAEGGAIYRTINGGSTWKQHGKASFYTMNTIQFGIDSTVYLAGQWGAVLRSGVKEFRIDSLDVRFVNNCAEFSAVITSILGYADSVSFQYGIGSFDHEVNANPFTVSNAQRKVLASVNDLLPSTLYKMRVKLFHEGQYIYSSNEYTFTTPPRPPTPVISPPGNPEICAGDSVILTSSALSGNQWYLENVAIPGATNQAFKAKQAGSYRIVRTIGCYSSDTSTSVTVQLNPIPPAPVITATGNTLSSSSASGNQWYLGNVPIPGAVQSNYTATQSGSYAVTTTVNGCASILSAPYVYFVTAIVDPVILKNIQIFPNPAQTNLYIQNNDLMHIEIKIFNITGMKVSTILTSKKDNVLDLSDFPSGPYVVSITDRKTLKRIQRMIVKF